MELNRNNLISLIENVGTCNLVVLDHWPGDRNHERCFFVMSEETERILSEVTSTAVLSSRLPKILDGHRVWFDAIRTVGANLSRSDEVMLTSDGTATDRYCRRVTELFRIKCVSLELLTLERLKKTLVRDQSADLGPMRTVYCITEKKAKADFLLGQIADTVYALSIKNNGNIQKSLQHRTSVGETHRTFVLRDDTMTKAKVREKMISHGAVDWLLLSNATQKQTEKFKSGEDRRNGNRISLSELEESEYLIHWTRARCGPWPDQSEPDHLDDLIFGQSGGRHGDVFSLCRILASQRIMSSSDLTRTTIPTVCFSDVSLSELRNRTVFRKHLHRWDFLPFGIAIKRKTLKERFNCRPVIYGDQETWESLPKVDQPFFQVNKSSDQKIDWQQEREWRVIGDIDLRQIDLGDAIVFAGNENDLGKLSQLSLFDLIVI